MGQGHDDDCCCCDHSICVSAWSLAAICAEVADDAFPDCSNHAVPGAISGTVVTITRAYTDEDSVVHTEIIDTCTTTGSGRCCVSIPEGIVDPVDAPTVDPVGGGASGCLLTPDTYDVRYSYRNPYLIADLGVGGLVYGETIASFPSPAFQVGIPDPQKFPFAANLSVKDTGGRAGSLAVGVYWIRHTYANPSGETISGSPIKIRVGMLDPTTPFSLSGTAGGGSLAPGSYQVRVSATDGTYFTAPIAYGPFTQSAGDIYRLTAPPALPFGATGWTVWISNDIGLTWHRYYHNVVPVFDVGIGAVAIPFGGALPAGTVVLPTVNTFPILDPRIVFPVSMASLRTYATEQRLYISQTNATTGFRRYMTGAVGPSADLIFGFPAPAPSYPTANSTARNIPQVTFPFGGHRTILYAKSLTNLSCKSFKATASPKDLAGTPDGSSCSLEINTTRGGHYDITVQPPDSIPATGGVDVLYDCFSAELSFGFCSYRIQIEVRDHDGGDVAGWYVAGDSGHITYDTSGLSVVMGLAPLEMTGCVFYDDEHATLNYCREDTGGGVGINNNPHHLTLRAPGYWDRCVFVNTPCDIPAATDTVGADMYSKANWVLVGCCGTCTEVASGGNVPEMLPKHLMASFTGPEGMTGSRGPITAEIVYNATRSATLGTPVWDACVGTGGWGICRIAGRADYQCLRQGPDPYNPCADPFVGSGFFFVAKRFYGSALLSWFPCDMHGGGFSEPLSYGRLDWVNYWDGGCPTGTDHPPACGGFPEELIESAVWCLFDCPCGTVQPDGHAYDSVGGVYSTKSGSSYVATSGLTHATTSGSNCSVVNWSQAQTIVLAPGSGSCPEDPYPSCSGTVTEI